jgi:hypothetical protein
LVTNAGMVCFALVRFACFATRPPVRIAKVGQAMTARPHAEIHCSLLDFH